MEGELSTALKAGLPGGPSLDAGGSTKLSREQRVELVRRAKNVVNQVQLHELNQLVKLLSEDIFTDRLQKFYIVIDRLDEEWAEDAIRYRLIKSLVDAIRKMLSVRNVKIIICLRTDILYKVLERTKTVGSQEEKYESLFLDLRWTDDGLREVCERRIAELFKRKYSGAVVSAQDIFPESQIDRKNGVDYIISRSLKRPRDVIHFINECLRVAQGRTRFTRDIIRTAERTYSSKRLRSIKDEWRSVYPNIEDYIDVLKGLKRSFSIAEIDPNALENFILRSASEDGRSHGPMHSISKEYMYGHHTKSEDVALELLYHLYVIGIVGAKTSGDSPLQWSFDSAVPLAAGGFKADYGFAIHPTFWFALGIG